MNELYAFFASIFPFLVHRWVFGVVVLAATFSALLGFARSYKYQLTLLRDPLDRFTHHTLDFVVFLAMVRGIVGFIAGFLLVLLVSSVIGAAITVFSWVLA